MKRTQCVSWAILCGAMALVCLPAKAQSNLCYNGSFNSPVAPLDGWNIDYDWTGIALQKGNHLNASFLSEYKGKKNVLKMVVPGGYESKIETALIEYEVGARYKCTFDLNVDVGGMRLLFLGYNLRPGIAPSSTPKLQDMRRIYKGETVMSGQGATWKSMTVVFPKAEISELAYSHLKKIRYITVLMFVPGSTFGSGNFYLANVKIVKLLDKCVVTKNTTKSSAGE